MVIKFNACDTVSLTKDNLCGTECIFDGPPPAEYDSWSDWVARTTNEGVFTAVIITAIFNKKGEK